MPVLCANRLVFCIRFSDFCIAQDPFRCPCQRVRVPQSHYTLPLVGSAYFLYLCEDDVALAISQRFVFAFIHPDCAGLLVCGGVVLTVGM